MNSDALIKQLIAQGWIRVAGKGDHAKFKHPALAGHVVVPHPRKDIAIGTLRNIYRQAGWHWK
ncbi:MAG: type II toxin-antitoxin system HicA family toxin [Burkholderiaceae bacterium]|jgi:predicted RNA binding protein YcfA (HicA-like mRNA interferase family)|nr:type II toxin-antitoxin system HicA family toxin [Burkholderiaceae bacterium]